MFEDSLMDGRMVADAHGMRRAAWAAVLLQGATVASVFLVPLLFPEKLVSAAAAPASVRINLRRRETPPKPLVNIQRSAPVKQFSLGRTPGESHVVARGALFHFPTAASSSDGPPALPGIGTGAMGSGSALVAGLASGGGPSVAVARSGGKPGALRVSQGVSAGLLLAPIRPVYPRLAIAARMEGTVVVAATIGKDGRIVGVTVVSGPEMLRSAAADAVRDARYKPFLLNGEPTDVVTTVSVTFRMGA